MGDACRAGIQKECKTILDAIDRIEHMMPHIEPDEECYERGKDVVRAVIALLKSLEIP